MEIFIDSASLDKIKEVMKWGVITGCTTNPKILLREKGCDFEKRMKDIIKLVKGPVFIEVTTNDTKEMIKEAEKYNKWGKNVVVKIPMNPSGLKAVRILKGKGIKTNVTACMAVNQAILATKAGAYYVSFFFGRIGDMGYDGIKVIEDVIRIFEKNKFKTKIIVGSIRHLMDVNRIAATGVDIITIPYEILKSMTKNPKTTYTIDQFLDFWKEFKKAR